MGETLWVLTKFGISLDEKGKEIETVHSFNGSSY